MTSGSRTFSWIFIIDIHFFHMEIPENVRRSSLGIFQSCPFSHVAISNVLVAKYWINLGKGNRSAMSHVTQSLEQFRALMYV